MISYMLQMGPTINHYFGRRGKFTYLPKEVKQYREHVQDVVAAAGHAKLEGRLQVVIAISMASRRRSDLDNRAKAILDALTHAGAWADDEQVDVLILVRQPVSKGGYCRVVITELDGPIEAHATAALEAIHGEQEA